MAGQSSTPWGRRVVKAGGPPALITAALGVGATGVAGRAVERETAPVADGVASAIGVDSQFGPALLVVAAVLVLVVASIVPAAFEGHAD